MHGALSRSVSLLLAGSLFWCGSLADSRCAHAVRLLSIVTVRSCGFGSLRLNGTLPV